MSSVKRGVLSDAQKRSIHCFIFRGPCLLFSDEYLVLRVQVQGPGFSFLRLGLRVRAEGLRLFHQRGTFILIRWDLFRIPGRGAGNSATERVLVTVTGVPRS